MRFTACVKIRINLEYVTVGLTDVTSYKLQVITTGYGAVTALTGQLTRHVVARTTPMRSHGVVSSPMGQVRPGLAFKTVTRCHIFRLRCTKFNLGWGSAQDRARWGRLYSAPQMTLLQLMALAQAIYHWYTWAMAPFDLQKISHMAKNAPLEKFPELFCMFL